MQQTQEEPRTHSASWSFAVRSRSKRDALFSALLMRSGGQQRAAQRSEKWQRVPHGCLHPEVSGCVLSPQPPPRPFLAAPAAMARQVVTQKSRAYFKRFQVKYRRRRSASPINIRTLSCSVCQKQLLTPLFISRSGEDRLPVRKMHF